MKRASIMFIYLLLAVGLFACNNTAQPSNLEANDNMPALVENDSLDYLATPRLDIYATFYSVGEFIDGVAVVRVGGIHYGLIDVDGNFIVEPIYLYISEFVDGVAAARTFGRFDLIDIDGNIIGEPLHIGTVIDNIAVVRQNDRFGLKHLDGGWVLEPTYEYLRFQAGGVAIFGVTGGENANGRSGMSYGIIDINGNVIAEPIYTEIFSFVDNVAILILREEPWQWYTGIMYIDGSWVLEPKFQAHIQPFSRERGLAAFNFDGKWGFLNTQGEIIIEAQYAWVDWQFLGEYILVFDFYERYHDTASVHNATFDVIIFQYRVIDLLGNTIYADNNKYKIRNPFFVHSLRVRVENGINYYPVINSDNLVSSMFDPNGLYTMSVRDGGYVLTTGVEPFEVAELPDSHKIEWVRYGETKVTTNR